MSKFASLQFSCSLPLLANCYTSLCITATSCRVVEQHKIDGRLWVVSLCSQYKPNTCWYKNCSVAVVVVNSKSVGFNEKYLYWKSEQGEVLVLVMHVDAVSLPLSPSVKNPQPMNLQIFFLLISKVKLLDTTCLLLDWKVQSQYMCARGFRSQNPDHTCMYCICVKLCSYIILDSE